MELGEQLQKLREQKNMSREELAQEMNVSRQAVYKW
ncbi:helix-turn-helix transcriptional regulator, partial [Priestia megaterium]